MQRIKSVDLFRFLAIVAVIIIHISWFKDNATLNASNIAQAPYFLFNQLSRFAVPFFFILSGYFWGVKTPKNTHMLANSLPMIKKLLFLFVIWSVIYLLPYNVGAIYEYGISGPLKVAYWQFTSLWQNPITTLMQGTKVHLWFLMALLNALLITAFLVQYKQIKLLILIAFALYFIGLLAKAYSQTAWGISLNFETRHGPFFSTIFFVTGYLLSTKKITIHWFNYGLVFLCMGATLHFLESYFLWQHYKVLPLHEYLIGTYFVGIGVAMIALSNKSCLRYNALSQLGKLTLGIYVVHYIYVDILKPFDPSNNTVTEEILHLVIVLILSILTTIALSKNKYTKRLVM